MDIQTDIPKAQHRYFMITVLYFRNTCEKLKFVILNQIRIRLLNCLDTTGRHYQTDRQFRVSS